MGQWASCLTEGTLCLALPCKRQAAGAPLQMIPRRGQSLCGGDGYEHSVPARPCRSTVRPQGHVRVFGATCMCAHVCACVRQGIHSNHAQTARFNLPIILLCCKIMSILF